VPDPTTHGAHRGDRITRIELGLHDVPLACPVSDAKVLTGRQKPMAEVSVLTCHVATADGLTGLGFSYTTRAGCRAQFAHAKEVASVALGQDPSDIAKIYDSLLWAGASVGRSGVATQAISTIDTALWDVKARRAGLSLAKLLGSHRDSVRTYNTSGGFLQAPVEEVCDKASASLAAGIGGIKMKVGQPDLREDLRESPPCASTSVPTCRSWSTPTSSGTVRRPCAPAGRSPSTTSCGSRSRSTPTTPRATRPSAGLSTRPSRRARC